MVKRMKTEIMAKNNVIVKEQILDMMKEMKEQMKEAVKDILLDMIPSQRQNKAQAKNIKKEPNPNNTEYDDKNLSYEEE